MITIVIKSDRQAEGKTTIANVIHKALSEHGFGVELRHSAFIPNKIERIKDWEVKPHILIVEENE